MGTVCGQAMDLGKKILLSESCRFFCGRFRLVAAFLAVDLLQHLVEQ